MKQTAEEQIKELKQQLAMAPLLQFFYQIFGSFEV